MSDTSAITPPCSPPCDVTDNVDVEEGELQDEDEIMEDIRYMINLLNIIYIYQW